MASLEPYCKHLRKLCSHESFNWVMLGSMTEIQKNPKQAEVIVYSKDYCPYCDAAKNLFSQRGVVYQEIDVGVDADQLKIMLEKAAPRRTVPQIFIADEAVGGFDDLKALDDAGSLEGKVFPEGRE